MLDTDLKPPPININSKGEERSIGFEFEFTGVEMETAAELIQSLYGGEINKITTYTFEIFDTQFGNFKLELDAQLLNEKKYESMLKSIGIDISKLKNIQSIEGKLKDLASSVVPYEITSPPIQLSHIHNLNTLIEGLRNLKAKGTGSSIFYAFGLHINPEVPDPSVESLLNHLRAYVLLDPWIRHDASINVSRQISPYIKEFKEDFVQLILLPDYKPTLDEFIREYFMYDNSRNRPLDLLPLFMFLNRDLTEPFLKDTLTMPRPTYHYRLPDCSIEDPRWSLASEWNRWVLVETLAEDDKALNKFATTYLEMKNETLLGFESKWIKTIQGWINGVS